jgi:regulator of sirC expression with transglutaminase-like and TPR domain
VSTESRRRFAETVQSTEPDLTVACLLIGAEVRPDADLPATEARLAELAAEVVADVTAGASAYDQAVGLRSVLGDRHGFRGYGDDYGDLRASLLHEVVERRRGLPILLSVVYLDVARRAGIPAYGVGLPGHFVVAVGEPESATLLDPYVGGRLTSLPELSTRVPDGVDLAAADVAPWQPVDIVARVLNNIRVLAARTGDVRTRLWAADLSLLLPTHHVELRRERGELRARLGDYLGAAHDLEQYAEAVADTDDDRAEEALGEARMVRSRLN